MRKRRERKFCEEDFTLKLAIQDTLPVLFFLGSMIVLSVLFPSVLFIIGASCSLIAGFSKVLWKFLMAVKLGNKKWLSNLFIPFQCMGFTLMILSLFVDRRFISSSEMWKAVSSLPSGVFFLVGVIGMVGMITMSMHFDQSVNAHWRAQLVNTLAQGCFFVGLLLLV
ncbi:MAG: hypothetical protein Q4G58_15335 [bacterium]|nr:hypothetical protein [bacterium]